jgi:hypothetical protein
MRRAELRALVTLALAIPVVLIGCQGCGTSAPTVRWKSGMQKWFANTSVQPDEPPRNLWTQKDQNLLQRRIGYADAAFVGKVRIVSEYSAYDQTSQVSLAVTPTKVLHGLLEADLSKDGAIMLKLDPSSEGFAAAVRSERRPGTRYLVFIKRKPLQGKEYELRWALYQPTKELLHEVRAMYAWLEQARKHPPKVSTDVAMAKDAGKP